MKWINKYLKKGYPNPKAFTSKFGLSKIKKQALFKNLKSIIPSNSLEFCKNLDEADEDK